MRHKLSSLALTALLLGSSAITTSVPVQAATTNVTWSSSVVDNLRVVYRTASLDGQPWVALGDLHSQLFLKMVNLQDHLNGNYTGTLTAGSTTVNTRWGRLDGMVFVPLTSINGLFVGHTASGSSSSGLSSVISHVTSSISNYGDPTAAQVRTALFGFYATQKVWPSHFHSFISGQPYFIGNPPAGTQWDANTNDWVGLSTVFPSQPSSAWAKDLGMLNAPANQPIKAATLSQWIMNWETDARAVNLYQNGKLMYPTSSSFGLLQLYSAFYGTNITSPSTVITRNDLNQVIKNLTNIDNGYRLLSANKMELLLPMYGDPDGTIAFYAGLNGSYQKWWGDTVKEVDSITLTFSNNGVTYYRANYGGLFMSHAFHMFKSGSLVAYNHTNTLASPQVQAQNKVPLTFNFYPQQNYGSYPSNANSLNPSWNPYGGTYFHAAFSGPENATTLAGDHPGGNGDATITTVPDYYVQLNGSRIENVLFANSMNPYPDQL